MASNSFGDRFRITTWGESHGPAIGVVIDGCRSGMPLSEEEINLALAKRAPGKTPWVSPRQEPDLAEILSGVYEGKTTGAPLSIIIRNKDVNSEAYRPLQNLYRPGHATYTYQQKYGHFDPRGGGRASARETACRVAAGAVAKKYLAAEGIEICAYIKELGGVSTRLFSQDPTRSPLFCPDAEAEVLMLKALNQAIAEGDSLGGIVQAMAIGVPVGWGDPVYGKLEALLAQAMLSIPASKGFEIGDGFAAARLKGSQHNDSFYNENGSIALATNHSGGTLGGISTGAPLLIAVPFKPTSSIKKEQTTVDFEGKLALLKLPEGSRHDPCVAIRAVPVVEAMMALTLAQYLP